MTEGLKPHLILVSFYDPVEGSLIIPAKDKEDARAKALELYSKRKDVVIVDIISIEEDPPQEVPDNVIYLKPKEQ